MYKGPDQVLMEKVYQKKKPSVFSNTYLSSLCLFAYVLLQLEIPVNIIQVLALAWY